MIRKDENGIEIKIGDTVHCFDDYAPNMTASLRGVVNEKDGKIYVGDNDLAIGCAPYVEIII